MANEYTIIIPPHTRCRRCLSTQHYLTVTNEVLCGCDDRFICARCIIEQRDGQITKLQRQLENAGKSEGSDGQAKARRH